jgi:hypothetical protein
LPSSPDAYRFGNLAPSQVLLPLKAAEVDRRHGERRVAHMTHSDASRKQHDDQMVEMSSWQTERYEAKRTGKAYPPPT